MPWKETNVMEQKERFIQEMLTAEKPFKHLCAEYGITEKTGYKWKKRFYEQGKAGLNEQSRARLSQTNEIDGDTVAELISLKMAHLHQQQTVHVCSSSCRHRNPMMSGV